MQKDLKQLEKYVKAKVRVEIKKNPTGIVCICAEEIEKFNFSYDDLCSVVAKLEERLFLKTIVSDGDLQDKCVNVYL